MAGSRDSDRRAARLQAGRRHDAALTRRERDRKIAILEVNDMVEVLRGNPHEVVIRVSGGFDASAGAQLARCIEELPRAKRVVVDFTRLSSFHDADVCAVARGLVKFPELRIRGLGRHQLRLLRYCGVSLPAAHPLPEERED
jgi:hypothetical protein